MSNSTEVKHTLATRLVHACLALAVITQLLSSQVMAPPEHGRAGNWFFEVHQYVGLVAFALVIAFWLVLALRRRGTEASALFPWLSKTRLHALWQDIKTHGSALMSFRLPAYEQHGPLASVVHGLGLLLMTAMAATGAIYYAINTGDAGGVVGAVMLVHRSLANLAWAYLIGHAGMAIVYHFASGLRLGEMWSLASGGIRQRATD